MRGLSVVEMDLEWSILWTTLSQRAVIPKQPLPVPLLRESVVGKTMRGTQELRVGAAPSGLRSAVELRYGSVMTDIAVTKIHRYFAMGHI